MRKVLAVLVLIVVGFSTWAVNLRKCVELDSKPAYLTESDWEDLKNTVRWCSFDDYLEAHFGKNKEKLNKTVSKLDKLRASQAKLREESKKAFDEYYKALDEWYEVHKAKEAGEKVSNWEKLFDREQILKGKKERACAAYEKAYEKYTNYYDNEYKAALETFKAGTKLASENWKNSKTK